MKKTTLILTIISLLTTPTLAQYAGGSGTPQDPYRISLPQHLDYMHYHPEHYESSGGVVTTSSVG